MAGVPIPDTPTVAPTTDGSGLQRFLRKARGQIEKPTNVNIHTVPNSNVKSEYGSDPVSETGSGYTSSLLDQKQIAGEVFAEGGLTRFYQPIPEYEGRHRWDPHAEWTPEEEKKLVRRVCLFEIAIYSTNAWLI